MSRSSYDLWTILNRENLVSGNMPEFQHLPTPWYIRVIHGVGGWLSACCIVLFLALSMLPIIEETIPSLIISLICLITSRTLYVKKANSDYFSQLALASSFVAQGLILYHLFEAGLSHSNVALLFSLLHVGLFFLFNNYLHRVISSFLVVMSLAYPMVQMQAEHLYISILCAAFILVFYSEYKLTPTSKFIPAAYGVMISTLMLMFSMFSPSFYNELMNMPSEGYIPSWVSNIAIAGLFLYIVHGLTKQLNTQKSLLAIIYIISGLFSVITLEVSGFALALAIILLGFNNGNRVLLTTGIISSLAFISYYYYNLETTLFVKSLIMMGAGLLLLLGWYFVNKELGASHE